jgi:hypothetical protein
MELQVRALFCGLASWICIDGHRIQLTLKHKFFDYNCICVTNHHCHNFLFWENIFVHVRVYVKFNVCNPKVLHCCRMSCPSTAYISKDENCALLGYYSVSSGNFLLTFQDNLLVPHTLWQKPEIMYI